MSEDMASSRWGGCCESYEKCRHIDEMGRSKEGYLLPDCCAFHDRTTHLRWYLSEKLRIKSCPECKCKWVEHVIGPCIEKEVCTGVNHVRCAQCNNDWCYYHPAIFFIEQGVKIREDGQQ